MVKRYKAALNCNAGPEYEDLVEDASGDWYHRRDYAALEAELKDARDGMARLKMGFDHVEAERDELQRRLDAVVKDLEPKPGPPNPTNPTAVDVAIWRESRSIHRRISRIAEGRDNG